MAAIRFLKPEVIHLGRGFRYFIEIWFGNRFLTPWTSVTDGNSIKYCRKTANIYVKKPVHDTYKSAKINFINSGAVDIIRTVCIISTNI